MLGVKEIFGEAVEEQNAKYMEKLKENLKEDKVTWVLGAGVSMPAGLPQWDVLIKNMWTLLAEIGKRSNGKGGDKEDKDIFQDECIKCLEMLEKEELTKPIYLKKFYAAMKGEVKGYLKDINVLEAAEYLWNNIKEQYSEESGDKDAAINTLKMLVRESLQLGEGVEKDKDKLKEKLEKESIGEIAKLLQAKNKGNIITYNFDDLLEFCLESVAGISKEDVWIGCDNHHEPGKELIRIYHPHGKIQLFSDWKPEESRSIILTESSYYDMEHRVYNWANSIQAKALAEESCVFIGFSGVDYNFRRIIKNCDKQQKGEKERHYIFMGTDALVSRFWGDVIKEKHKELERKLYKDEMKRREEIRKKCKRESLEWKELLKDVQKEKDEILKAILKDKDYIFEQVQMLNFCSAQTKYWKKYGIAPIWMPFEDMPKKIHEFAEKY